MPAPSVLRSLTIRFGLPLIGVAAFAAWAVCSSSGQASEARPPLILAIDGRTCHVPEARIVRGHVYARLSDLGRCGIRSEWLVQRGLIEIRFATGRRVSLWPWGEDLALVDGLRVAELPDEPWLWHDGQFFVRLETLEQLGGSNLGRQVRLEAIPVLPVDPPAFRVDPGSLRRGQGLRVLIDPGHGGDDHGTVDPTGLPEKVVTLQVSLLLRQVLQEAGYEVRLTREDDSYPTLSERVMMANSWDADLMLSLHANSAPRRAARGIETYYLSRVASDPRALELARFENAYEAVDLEAQDLLGGLLSDVARDAQEQTAGRLAPIFHERLVGHVGGQNRGVRKAPFFVLAGTTMPAFLVEIGFMSNDEEAELLRDESYQMRLAVALSAAVEAISPYLRGRVAGGRP